MSDVPVQIVALIGDYLVGEAKWREDFWQSLLVEEQAKRQILEFAITKVLNELPFGGTTAEYERALATIGHARYPSYQKLDAEKAEVRAQWSIEG